MYKPDEFAYYNLDPCLDKKSLQASPKKADQKSKT